MKTSSNIAVATILGLSLLTGDIAASTDESHTRFSIAISGGASKGAYEAGLNWGVIKLLREAADRDTLTGGQFFSPRIESITGASAGGINTLLSGLS